MELVGDAEGVGGDRPGQRDGDGLHQVTAAGGDERIEPTAHVDSGPRFVCRRRRRGEALAQDPADLRVKRRIHLAEEALLDGDDDSGRPHVADREKFLASRNVLAVSP